MPLFAEADPLGGWLQVILQGGALGLLGYIVIYIYPRSAAEARMEREGREKAFGSLVALMQDKFEERNQRVVNAIERQTTALNAAIGHNTNRIESAVRQTHNKENGP